MALLPILVYPDATLKQISQPVLQLDDATRQFIFDLDETMNAQPGCVGIAAPQTGNRQRIILIDVSRNRKPLPNNGKLVMINPVIGEKEGQVLGSEGCLSLPHLTANVIRAQRITVHYLDENMEEKQLATSDFEARVVLHEADHLDGILFLDRVSSLKTDVFRRKRYR
jgi:peptide deformylase